MVVALWCGFTKVVKGDKTSHQKNKKAFTILPNCSFLGAEDYREKNLDFRTVFAILHANPFNTFFAGSHI